MAKTDKRANRRRKSKAPPAEGLPKNILSVDIGGSKVKILLSGETEPRKALSGKKMTPARMVETVQELAKGWRYDAVSIGYPGLVGIHGPRSEPVNLGPGWVGFNFAAAFDRPVRIINDAAMQALGSYEDGRMLFLGFGTGLGSALISDHAIVPLELGKLLYDKKETLGEVLGRSGLDRRGKTAWREIVEDVVAALTDAFSVDYVVLGGGNARVIKDLPVGARLGHNLTAFRGGFRLWSFEDVPTLAAETASPQNPRSPAEWRVI